MGWGRRYPVEQQLARHALLSTANAASSALSGFVGWLLSVSGASFALLVANLEAISPYLHLRSFKWALAWFAISLLFGFISRWLGAMVAGAIAALGAIEEKASEGLPATFSLLAFTKLFSGGLLPGYRCMAWKGYRLTAEGELVAGLKPITYQSQTQAVLALLQLLLLFLAVAVLAHGIRA